MKEKWLDQDDLAEGRIVTHEEMEKRMSPHINPLA